MPKSYLSEMGLVFVAFVWGITFVVVKDAVGIMEPFIFNSLRFFLAATILLITIVVLRRATLMKMTWSTLIQGGILGFWLFLGYGFLTLGLVYTNASNAGFITGLNVVIVPLISILMLKKKLEWCTLAGIMAAFLGLYCLTIKGAASLNKGDMLTFLGAIAFSFHVIFTGKYSRNNSSILLVLIQFFTVGICSGVCALVFEDLSVLQNRDLMLSPEMILAMLVVVLFATGLAMLIQTRVQREVPPAKVALIYSLEPVFAAFSGYYWAGDILGPMSLMGCALIFSGMLIVDLPQRLKSMARIK